MRLRNKNEVRRDGYGVGSKMTCTERGVDLGNQGRESSRCVVEKRNIKVETGGRLNLRIYTDRMVKQLKELKNSLRIPPGRLE